MSSLLLYRPATPQDDAFLRLLFAATNPTLGALPEPVRAQLAEMQYRGRQLTYAAYGLESQELILCLPDGTAVGRMLFATRPTCLHLMDIAVLPEAQGRGCATLALEHLQELARAAGHGVVTLQVATGNPAERLYRRLGFVPTAKDEISWQMRWEHEREASLPASHAPSRLGTVEGSGMSRGFALVAALLLGVSATAGAQGILTVTPTRTAATTAGTGTVGYSGDGSAATAATLAAPGAVAYDKSNDLFVADTNNHVIREITPSGTITTVAGNGTEGFSGDGGAATSAQLDTPTGVAVDASGNIYIADSHNHRIREVSGGNITTIAGTGTPGFAGDGAAATAAQLALPSGVAVDASGNVYIADTNNHRIREISGGTITTIAGDGEELYAGDGGAATAASLDSPTGVAVSSTGTVYVADRLNQRIRSFTVGSTISTVAGSGSASFSGGFSGDGGSATAATLARPTGVSVDANGNVYVADSDNQRVRELVSGGAIASVVGSGAQGYGADGGPATSAILDTPKAVATDASGNLAVADTLDQRIRAGALPTLTFTTDPVGIASAPQSVTLANTGTSSITVSSVNFSGSFTTVAGGSCAAAPITLAGGASCTQNIAFLPTAPGNVSGSVSYGGTGVVPQSILLAGTGVQGMTTTSLISNIPTALAGQTILFTATIQPGGVGSPMGSVSFYDGSTLLGASPVMGGSASISTSVLMTGTDTISAVYSGDSNFKGSNSATLPQPVEDFKLSVASVTSLSIVPGTSATFTGSLQSLVGPFNYPIALSLTGLPPGATATFNPSTINLSSGPATTSLTIQTASTAWLHSPDLYGGGGVSFALLLLPFSFSRKLRKRARKAKLLLSIALLLGLGGLTALTGCGSGSGLLGQQQQTYTINLIGTATGANGYTLQRTTSVTLTVQ